MKRFRLSTLMLLIVIAAVCITLKLQQERAARREAALDARLAEANEVLPGSYASGIIQIQENATATNQEK